MFWALLIALSTIGEAKMIVPQKVILVEEGVIEKTEPLTLRFNDLDGIAYATFIIQLTDTDLRVAQFSWGVRPDARAQLETLLRTTEKKGYVSRIPKTNLTFDSGVLQGSIQHGKSSNPQTIKVEREKMEHFSVHEKPILAKWLESHQFKLELSRP